MVKQSVSVLVPCYNGAFTLETAIGSVISGTRMPDEILIYDDFSTDNSRSTAAKLEEAYENIRLITGDKNRGAGHSRTILLAAAKGEFVAFLDCDDWWYETKLEKQCALQAETGADIVSSHYDIYVEDGRKIGRRRLPTYINFWTMHLANWLPTSMTMVRASLIGAKHMPDIRKRQDYAYWLQIFAANKGLKTAIVPEALGGYQRRRNALSSSKKSNLFYNYRMFTQIRGYSPPLAYLCVLCNIVVALIRK